jgi:hypothetical protein
LGMLEILLIFDEVGGIALHNAMLYCLSPFAPRALSSPFPLACICSGDPFT